MALFDDVKEVVVEQLNVSPDEVKEESKFVEDLGADSLDVVELVMALEEKFDIKSLMIRQKRLLLYLMQLNSSKTYKKFKSPSGDKR